MAKTFVNSAIILVAVGVVAGISYYKASVNALEERYSQYPAKVRREAWFKMVARSFKGQYRSTDLDNDEVHAEIYNGICRELIKK